MRSAHPFLLLLLSAISILAASCGNSLPPDNQDSNNQPANLPEPVPGLAGTWLDQQEGTIHAIIWQDGVYIVQESLNMKGDSRQLISQEWNGSSLTWTYYIAETNVSVTIEAVGVSGETLYIDWTSTNGNSGTDTFIRQPG